mmetsp:Transcript_39593/g.86271  ORF Transcript_39593/g.86271 Transcript_39593/m.86271 type:complete len:276 (+) Transcript_39593:541-1368(+)
MPGWGRRTAEALPKPKAVCTCGRWPQATFPRSRGCWRAPRRGQGWRAGWPGARPGTAWWPPTKAERCGCGTRSRGVWLRRWGAKSWERLDLQALGGLWRSAVMGREWCAVLQRGQFGRGTHPPPATSGGWRATPGGQSAWPLRRTALGCCPGARMAPCGCGTRRRSGVAPPALTRATGARCAAWRCRGTAAWCSLPPPTAPSACGMRHPWLSAARCTATQDPWCASPPAPPAPPARRARWRCPAQKMQPFASGAWPGQGASWPPATWTRPRAAWR